MPKRVDYLDESVFVIRSPEEEAASQQQANWSDGQRLKAAYTAARREFETTRDGVESTYTPARSLDGKSRLLANCPERGKLTDTWTQMAGKLRELGFDPELYVHKLFRALAHSGMGMPAPKQLAHIKYQELLNAVEGGLDEDVRIAWLVQAREASRAYTTRLEMGRSPPAAVLEVLYNDNLPLSSLFRYSMAWLDRNREAMQAFEFAAALEYHPKAAAYQKVAAPVLPEGFAALAEKIYTAYMKQQGKTARR